MFQLLLVADEPGFEMIVEDAGDLRKIHDGDRIIRLEADRLKRCRAWRVADYQARGTLFEQRNSRLALHVDSRLRHQPAKRAIASRTEGDRHPDAARACDFKVGRQVAVEVVL